MVGGFLSIAFSSFATNTVSLNLIDGAMHRYPHDGGAIYFTNKEASGLSSTVSGNVISNTTSGPQGILYLDTSTSFMSWSGKRRRGRLRGADLSARDPTWRPVHRDVEQHHGDVFEHLRGMLGVPTLKQHVPVRSRTSRGSTTPRSPRSSPRRGTTHSALRTWRTEKQPRSAEAPRRRSSRTGTSRASTMGGRATRLLARRR